MPKRLSLQEALKEEECIYKQLQAEIEQARENEAAYWREKKGTGMSDQEHIWYLQQENEKFQTCYADAQQRIKELEAEREKLLVWLEERIRIADEKSNAIENPDLNSIQLMAATLNLGYFIAFREVKAYLESESEENNGESDSAI